MAIQTRGGQVSFRLITRPPLSDPIFDPGLVFPDFNFNSTLTLSFWVKTHAGFTNSRNVVYCSRHVRIWHDSTNWFFTLEDGTSVVLSTLDMGPIVFDRWTLFVFVKFRFNYKMFRGVESDPVDTENPVTLTEVVNTFSSIGVPFDMSLYLGFNDAICNLKIWNTNLSVDECVQQANRWDATGTGAAPIWASPLRTPGDLASIVNPYTGVSADAWYNGHAFQNPPLSSYLKFDPDPGYMAKHTPCPTWIYPPRNLGDPLPENERYSNYNPGLTPLIPTTYKATQFFQFEDKGSVPITPAQSIKYYGFPMVGTFVPQHAASNYWGLFKDQNGTEVSDTSNSIYGWGPALPFSTGIITTGASIPGSISSFNMYSWKFGAQFTWQPAVPPTPQLTAQPAFLVNIYLFVTYIGYPTGNPSPLVSDMAGLFAINKGGKSVDKYNGTLELKIPNPTIRTAYIGE